MNIIALGEALQDHENAALYDAAQLAYLMEDYAAARELIARLVERMGE